MSTHVTVSDVHHGVVNTYTMVSDIHRNMVEIQEGNDNQRRLRVSDIPAPFFHGMNTKESPLPRHKHGQQPRLSMNPMSYICI